MGPVTVRPPSLRHMLREYRALHELGAYYVARPLLSLAPSGDGHPVMVLPGFLASDWSTAPLRAYLRDRGYAPHGWGLGVNLGPIQHVKEDARRRVLALRRETGRKVSLIGWSLGGIYAREIARAHPEAVRLVITLGSPFAINPKANNAWRLYELASGDKIDEWEHDWIAHRPKPLPVPSTAIYSQSDGVTAWQCCVQPSGPLSESIEVDSSHCGLGHNPLALFAIADRLAQPEGRWRPLKRIGLRRLLYGPSRCRGAD